MKNALFRSAKARQMKSKSDEVGDATRMSGMDENSRLRRRLGTAGLSSGLSSSHFDGFGWWGWFLGEFEGVGVMWLSCVVDGWTWLLMDEREKGSDFGMLEGGGGLK
jgi:hypothetical protein